MIPIFILGTYGIENSRVVKNYAAVAAFILYGEVHGKKFVVSESLKLGIVTSPKTI